MKRAIVAIQVITAIFIIISVLLQQKGTGLGGVFGGSGISYRTKRGAEKFLFIFTILMASIFFVVTILGLYFY